MSEDDVMQGISPAASMAIAPPPDSSIFMSPQAVLPMLMARIGELPPNLGECSGLIVEYVLPGKPAGLETSGWVIQCQQRNVTTSYYARETAPPLEARICLVLQCMGRGAVEGSPVLSRGMVDVILGEGPRGLREFATTGGSIQVVSEKLPDMKNLAPGGEGDVILQRCTRQLCVMLEKTNVRAYFEAPATAVVGDVECMESVHNLTTFRNHMIPDFTLEHRDNSVSWVRPHPGAALCMKLPTRIWVVQGRMGIRSRSTWSGDVARFCARLEGIVDAISRAPNKKRRIDPDP